MERIQIVAVTASLSFLATVLWQIQKGKLREEYAFVWMLSTFVLIVLSFWRTALNLLAHLFGVFEPLNLIFTGSIFAILIYLLHLSVTVSRLHLQNKTLAQELALLRERLQRQSGERNSGDR